jgi:D-alanyl-D-alanine carboxypeptidase
MQQQIENYITSLNIPGALINLKSDKYPSFTLIYGYSDLNKKIVMNKNQQFKIGSITKTFIGKVIMELVKENKIGLDDLVSKYLDGIDGVTIGHIGTMRSGIFNYTNDEKFRDDIESTNSSSQPSLEIEWTPNELLKIGLSNKRNFEADTQFEYSNTNAIILAMIIEQVTGNTWQQEVTERIIKPLNLKNTGFCFEDNFMRGYEYKNGHFVDVSNSSMSWCWAAGAMVSTVNDLEKYCQYIGDCEWPSHHILPEFGINVFYGFHILKMESFIGHNGGLPGYSSYMLYEKETNTKIIIVVNIQEMDNGQNPANKIAEYMISLFKNIDFQ